MSGGLARLISLGFAVPAVGAPQSRVMEFATRVAVAHAPQRAAVLTERLEKIYRGSAIGWRFSPVADFLADSPEKFTFFPKNWALAPAVGTAARMAVYENSAVELAERAAKQALEAAHVAPAQITHLVMSTCTGFFAPGPDVALIRRLGLSPGVQRTLIGFMGCFAGFNGIRTADHIVRADPQAVVLQIAVEICSIHWQTDLSAETMVANALFSDGASAAVFGRAGRADLPAGLASVAATHSHVDDDSLDQMGWRIGDTGFQMRLSPAVPRTLQRNAIPFVTNALARADLPRSAVAGWAIHPGGRRIVEAMLDALELPASAGTSALGVLDGYGNMSSATIGFVLAAEFARHTATPIPIRSFSPTLPLNSPSRPSALPLPPTTSISAPIAALGFGPGLTMECAIFVP